MGENKKITLIPSSAGITTAASEAKSVPLLTAIKINAITRVDGRVPKIPPTFVPKRSAITVIRITTKPKTMSW